MATLTYKFKIENREVRTTVTSDEVDLSQCLSDLLSSISADRKIMRVVGLDIEKCYTTATADNPDSSHPSRLASKVAVLKFCAGRSCLVIHLIRLKSIPTSLASFLDLPHLSFVGVGIEQCLMELKRDYGLDCRKSVDLGQLAATVKGRPYLTAYGLADLANEVGLPNVTVNGPGPAFSDWGAKTLSADQVKSATVDAFLPFYIGNQLLGGLCL